MAYKINKVNKLINLYYKMITFQFVMQSFRSVSLELCVQNMHRSFCLHVCLMLELSNLLVSCCVILTGATYDDMLS